MKEEEAKMKWKESYGFDSQPQYHIEDNRNPEPRVITAEK
jgi:hypothetical protein